MKEWLTTGIPYEIAFWDNLYANKRELGKMLEWSCYGDDIFLHNFDAVGFLTEYRQRTGKSPQVWDVGCGLSYATGNHLHGKPVDIRYIDPLACFYNRILKRYKKDLSPIEFGMLEYLSSTTLQFKVGDGPQLIVIQNALDHSANPVKGILECLECLEIGGVLYLKHWPNEAETENYRGFHKYNITEKDGQLIIWNPLDTVRLNGLIGDFCDIVVSRGGERNAVIAVITKKAPVPQALLTPQADVDVLCRNLLAVVEAFNSPGFAFRYHMKAAFYRYAQFFARLLPSNARSSLKKLLRKH